MTKPLSAEDARWLAAGVVTHDMVPALEAIRDGHHVVVEKRTMMQAKAQFEAYFQRGGYIYGESEKAGAWAWWAAALEELGVIE